MTGVSKIVRLMFCLRPSREEKGNLPSHTELTIWKVIPVSRKIIKGNKSVLLQLFLTA